MTIWADMLDDIYQSEIAVNADLDTGTAGDAVTVRVIDKTAGVEVGGEGDAASVRAAAFIRMSELTSNSLTRADLDAGTLTIDGKAWRIDGHVLRPMPTGELRGEVCAFLIEAAS